VRIVDDDGDRGLNKLVRSLMGELRQELTELDARIADYDRKIRELYRSSEVCQRLGKIEGIGPVTATALVAALGDRSSFKNGRQFAAWLGLVPRQRSSGGRAKLLGIVSVEIVICVPCSSTALARRSDEFEKSRIQGACGSARCGNGDAPTSSPSLSPTKMPASPGACSPAIEFTTPAFQCAQPERNPKR
jgi:transposase